MQYARNRLSACISFLKDCRRVKNATDFSAVCGVQKSYVSEILAGKHTLTENFARKVGRAFPEISIRWLLTGDGEMSRMNSIWEQINRILAREGLPTKEYPPDTDIRFAIGWIECLLTRFPRYEREFYFLLNNDEEPGNPGPQRPL